MSQDRTRLFQKLEELCSQIQDDSHWVGLLLLDIREFKTINRTYGYLCGDQILHHIFEELQLLSKDPSLIFKLGNDEFALILPNLNSPSLIGLAANKIIDALKKPFVFDDQKIIINFNLGCSSTNQSTDNERLLLVTEHSLSQAKEQNQTIHIADIKSELYGSSDLSLLTDFKKALYDNELELYYQPKINLHNKTEIHAEALLRWHHPSRGFIPPDQFLPLCEKLGLNLELTQWVLNTALRHQAEWPHAQPPTIAVNVSADIIDSPELYNLIENAITIWNSDPQKLTIEITESAIIGDKASGFNNLKKVRDLGVKISIDDFGTGYSSLAYFKNIPADEVKIDRSFIDNMVKDEADKRIVELIVSLAKSFNLYVVAEGIETEQQLDLVTQLKCSFAQGYFLSKPINYQAFISWASGEKPDNLHFLFNK